MSNLYDKNELTFEDYPEYKILGFYQNTKMRDTENDSFQPYPDMLEPDFTKKILHKIYWYNV